MSIIIVEGVDGSGKTTLLRHLREQSQRYFWVASSSRRPKTKEELQEAVFWVAQATYLKLPVICDRFPLISELVYGPVMRGKDLTAEFEDRTRKSFIATLESVDRVIYCRPPKTVIARNLHQNPQMEGVSGKLQELLGRYDEVMQSLTDTLSVIHYDYSSNTSPIEGMFFGKRM